MPWELCVLKYDGKLPRLRTDGDKSRELPLGTLADVRQQISKVLRRTEWSVTPSLIQIMKDTGNDMWKSWDPEMIAASSKAKLRGCYERGETTFEMFGFEQPEPLQFFLLDVRGRGNPIPLLRKLCEPKGWTVVEMGIDGEFLDLNGNAEKRWNGWEDYLDRALNQTDTSETS